MPKPPKRRRPVVLSIAGYDPSSGAGITADIKTMAAHRCYGVTCITALPVQSTRGGRRVPPGGGHVIAARLHEPAGGMQIAPLKSGRLGSRPAARAVPVLRKRPERGD